MSAAAWRRADRAIYALLAEKYRRMIELRRLDATGLGGDPRPAARALATRHPGALRELDELPMEVLEERRAALERVLAGRGAPEAWMYALARYHGWLRLALRIRRGVLPLRTLERARAYLAAHPPDPAEGEPAEPLSDEFLAALLAPPAGRLNPIVFARVAAETGLTPRAIEALLIHRRARTEETIE
jgi:hypothetical protein